MTELGNGKVTFRWDAAGRLIALSGLGTEHPIDASGVTAPFEIQLRSADGKVTKVTPQSDPTVETFDTESGNAARWAWELTGAWGALNVRATVELPHDEQISYWCLEIDNHTDQAIWQAAYPRLTGLTAYEADGPDWLAYPWPMGAKEPRPVAFVNQTKPIGRRWKECLDPEAGPADIAHTYPGMLCMQYLAYGHPSCGGIYFGAHDGQALYKCFGMYADGATGRHAALVIKQYPEDRTAAGADFRSFYPSVVGVYEGDWWGASEVYRLWALEQFWCKPGLTRDRADIPDWVKQTDLWYWNWQQPDRGHPDQVIGAMRYIKERFGCAVAFHWYGYSGEFFDSSWTTPHYYPHNPDVFDQLTEGVRRLHELGVHCLPYINTRLWNHNTRSFRAADGMKWAVQDEHGQPADVWARIGHTMCPTAPPFHDVIRDIQNRLMDDCDLDGAYLDQVTSCYVVPCFNPDHDHAPGGHDHWCRGYRQLLDKVRDDMRQRKADSAITSEGTLECFLDQFDADLAREISDLHGHTGSDDVLPIPMAHSVYHDYHITYGTVLTFDEKYAEHYRYGEALTLVGGGQLMISGFFAGDEDNEKHKPYRDYIEQLTRAHVAGRRWLNLGRWMPPLDIECERVEVRYDDDRPPKCDIPAILSGCFLLDGQLCIVLVNHTDRPQIGRYTVNFTDYGFDADEVKIAMIYPDDGVAKSVDARRSHQTEHQLGGASAQVWIVRS